MTQSSLDKLTLISGIDIAIPEIRVSLHQPTIREIAYIGEVPFYSAANVLTMSVDSFLFNNEENLSEQDKLALSSMTNFHLFMMITRENNLLKNQSLMLLTLLFPLYKIVIEERFIMFTHLETKEFVFLNEEHFDSLQEVMKDVLCLRSSDQDGEYNPEGKLAKSIAEKLKKGKARVAAMNGEKKEVTSTLSKYISGLGIGTSSLNMLNVLELTLYQFFNQIERFGLHESYKMSIQAKMAGAKDVEDIDWLKDI